MISSHLLQIDSLYKQKSLIVLYEKVVAGLSRKWAVIRHSQQGIRLYEKIRSTILDF